MTESSADSFAVRPRDQSWGSGGSGHRAALESICPAVKIVAWVDSEDYQGDCLALIRFGNTHYLWKDYYGSCSGCDSLEGVGAEDAYDYVVGTLKNAIRVEGVRGAVKFLTTRPEGDPWSELSSKLLVELQKEKSP